MNLRLLLHVTILKKHLKYIGSSLDRSSGPASKNLKYVGGLQYLKKNYNYRNSYVNFSLLLDQPVYNVMGQVS